MWEYLTILASSLKTLLEDNMLRWLQSLHDRILLSTLFTISLIFITKISFKTLFYSFVCCRKYEIILEQKAVSGDPACLNKEMRFISDKTFNTAF